MALEEPHPESATSATQQAFDGLVRILAAAAPDQPVTIGTLGAPPPTETHDVLVSPLSLTRVGRSRRAGSLLDLELAVAVQVAGEAVLTLAERMLLAVEVTPHSRIDPLPSDRPGFGFVIVLPVNVAVAEPAGPPVIERIVQVELVPPNHEGG